MQWRWKAVPAPRPLYGLDELASRPNDPVMVCEGEKAADAAQRLLPDFVVVTSPNGANAARKANWQPLQGRVVTVWPDSDSAGAKYAADVAELVASVGATSIATLDLSHLITNDGVALPEGFDAVDFEQQGRDNLLLVGAIRRPIPASPPCQSRTSGLTHAIPLVRNVPAAAPYPTEALGPILSPAAKAIAELIQVSEALAGNSVLATAALAAQAHADVETLGVPRPLSLYLFTVAESGERKTTADSIAAEPIREHIATLQLDYQNSVRDYEAKIEAHKMRVRLAKDHAKTPDDLQAALRDLREAKPPRKPWLIATEPTAEGLLLSLKDGQYSQGLFSDEAGTLIGGYALSEDSELRTIAMLSRIWDGSPLDRVRAKDLEHVTLNGRRLSMHLMTQPAVALRMLGKSLYRSQGLLARFLIAEPASLIGTRKYSKRAVEPKDDPRVREYCKAIAKLLRRSPVENQELDGLNPTCLALDSDARNLLISAYDKIEAAQGRDGDLSTVKEFASKACKHACRIAGVLTLVSNPEARSVSIENMANALELAKFYLSEQARLTGSAAISSEITNARLLMDSIRRKGLTELTATWVMQRGPNSIRDAKSAKAVLRTLVEYGWLSNDGGNGYRVPPAAQLASLEG